MASAHRNAMVSTHMVNRKTRQRKPQADGFFSATVAVTPLTFYGLTHHFTWQCHICTDSPLSILWSQFLASTRQQLQIIREKNRLFIESGTWAVSPWIFIRIRFIKAEQLVPFWLRVHKTASRITDKPANRGTGGEKRPWEKTEMGVEHTGEIVPM